jgi:DNA-3-methyladenine glycosylase II
MHIVTFHPKPPYRFGLLLDLLSRYAHPTMDIARRGAYWRCLRSGDGLALFRVTSVDTTEQPALDVHLMAQSGTPDVEAALATLRHMLALDHDPNPFYDFAHSHESLWRIVEPLIGLPELRTASLFEALTQAIIEQQIAWTSAQRAQRWLVEWVGNSITYDGHTYFAAATPAHIAASTIDDLKPLKITFKRMGVLIDIAQQINSGALNLEYLCAQPPEAAYRALLALKGIGHWTAVVALGRACGHDYGIADTDVGLQIAVNRYFYGGDGRIPAAQVMETFTHYGPFAGLAAEYTLIRYVLDQYPVHSGYLP